MKTQLKVQNSYPTSQSSGPYVWHPCCILLQIYHTFAHSEQIQSKGSVSHSSLSLCWSHEFSPHLKSFTFLSFQPLFKWFCFWVCVLSRDSFCLWWVWWQISIERLLTWGDASSVSVSGPDVFAVWKEVCKKLQWFIICVSVKPIGVFVSLDVFSVIAEHTGGIPEESFGSLPEVRTELWCSVFFFTL